MDKEIEFFEKYAKNFDLKEPNLNRKYKHTYRVMEYSNIIASSLDLEEKEIIRANVCALFHDLGRFSQYNEYKTYIDSKSFDHGDKSYEILVENNYKDNIVLNAVKYHNKKEVPMLDELTKMHCNIVRDADKLDIMDTQINELSKGEYVISEELLRYFKNHELIDNIGESNDFISLLRMIAFIFDINYKKTIEIILEKDIINRKIELLRKNVNSEKIDFIEKEVKKYINERFDIKC